MRANAFRLTAFALCLLFARAAAAQEPAAVVDDRWQNGFTEPWWFESNRYTAEQAAAARALWERTGDGDGGDGWAGVYLIDTSVRAHVLRVSPKGFVFFNVNTCMANVDDLDYGEVVADTPAYFEVVSKHRAGTPEPRKYVKVKWGGQRYLVEEYAVASFCDYVAGLGPYNQPRGVEEEREFLSHHEDGGKPTALLPTVPPEYRQYVRRPIDARVTRVGKAYVEVVPDNEWWDELVTPVRINAGSDQGLRRGMTLNALDSEHFNEQVEVTRVGRDYAHGIVVRRTRKRPGVKVNEWDDGKDEPDKPVAVGWRLTTSLHRWLQRADELRAAEEAGRK